MRILDKFIILFVAASAVGLSPIRADLLFENPPLNTGGPDSDTDFIYGPVDPYWQILADDFVLQSAAQVERVSWRGFYGGQFYGNTQPPAGDETMRIRFHSSRIGDGLPGQILYEQEFVNTSRIATGQYVSDTRLYPEYRFEADLAIPFSVNPDEGYWLEIEQVGIQSSTFRWEFAWPEGTPFASKNLDYPEWTIGYTNLNFQLFGTPEPTSILPFVFFVSARSVARGGRRPRRP